jgi:hypothetical protein
MSFKEFTTTFPGTHVTSWQDDEGFSMVTVGIPGVEASTLFVGEYEEVLMVWDMIDGHRAPYYDHPLYVALDEHMERRWAEEHAGAGDSPDTYLAAADGSAQAYFTENAL